MTMQDTAGESRILAAIATLSEQIRVVAKNQVDQKLAVDRLGDDNLSLHSKVDGALVRIGSLEADNTVAKRKMLDVATVASRAVSESDLKHQADLSATVTHVQKHREQVESDLSEIKSKGAERDVKLDKTIVSVSIIAEELGLSAKIAEAQAGTTESGRPVSLVKPKPPATMLSKISKENKAGIAASGLTAIILVLEIVLRLLAGH